MADDWAEKYGKDHEQELEEKRQKERDIQRRRAFAETGAQAKFSEVRKRIEQDIQTLRGHVMFAAIELQEFSENEFTLTHRGSPWVELQVKLHAIMIKVDYKFSAKEGAAEKQAHRESKTLRICSDLDGDLTVYQNGSGEALADDSEISEFLLKPVLDYIKG